MAKVPFSTAKMNLQVLLAKVGSEDPMLVSFDILILMMFQCLLSNPAKLPVSILEVAESMQKAFKTMEQKTVTRIMAVIVTLADQSFMGNLNGSKELACSLAVELFNSLFAASLSSLENSLIDELQPSVNYLTCVHLSLVWISRHYEQWISNTSQKIQGGVWASLKKFLNGNARNTNSSRPKSFISEEVELFDFIPLYEGAGPPKDAILPADSQQLERFSRVFSLANSLSLQGCWPLGLQGPANVPLGTTFEKQKEEANEVSDEEIMFSGANATFVSSATNGNSRQAVETRPVAFERTEVSKGPAVLPYSSGLVDPKPSRDSLFAYGEGKYIGLPSTRPLSSMRDCLRNDRQAQE